MKNHQIWFQCSRRASWASVRARYTFARKPRNFPLVEGPAVARVLDTATGMDTSAAGLNKDFYMWMPQFSPDGDKVVFNHAKSDGMGGTDRRELAIMDYDAATNTFSNLRVIFSGATQAARRGRWVK